MQGYTIGKVDDNEDQVDPTSGVDELFRFLELEADDVLKVCGTMLSSVKVYEILQELDGILGTSFQIEFIP